MSVPIQPPLPQGPNQVNKAAAQIKETAEGMNEVKGRLKDLTEETAAFASKLRSGKEEAAKGKESKESRKQVLLDQQDRKSQQVRQNNDVSAQLGQQQQQAKASSADTSLQALVAQMMGEETDEVKKKRKKAGVKGVSKAHAKSFLNRLEEMDELEETMMDNAQRWKPEEREVVERFFGHVKTIKSKTSRAKKLDEEEKSLRAKIAENERRASKKES